MANAYVSVAVGLLTFGVGLLGLFLQRLLPERHMSAGSRDMIGAVMGLLSLLLALVLGTLVGSAYGFFASQKADVESLCARSLELDLAFRQYGPETEALRRALKSSMQEALDAVEGDAEAYRRFPARRLHVQVREMERHGILTCPAYAGTDAADIVHGRKLPVLPADSAAHVLAARELDFLDDDRGRRLLGDALVLWLWRSLPSQRDERRRARVWRIRDR
jgi:hypothetical protein